MATATVTDTIHRLDDAVHASKEAIKTVKHRAQDMLDVRYELVHRIRREPMKALGIAFGAGIVIGAVAGFACMWRGSYDRNSTRSMSH